MGSFRKIRFRRCSTLPALCQNRLELLRFASSSRSGYAVKLKLAGEYDWEVKRAKEMSLDYGSYRAAVARNCAN
jgi:hypothetical protein